MVRHASERRNWRHRNAAAPLFAFHSLRSRVKSSIIAITVMNRPRTVPIGHTSVQNPRPGTAHYEQQRRHNPCGYARCHPDAEREPRCLGGCGVKSPNMLPHDVPRLYPERHGRNACHKAEHIDCKHMIAERMARLMAELAAHKRKTLAKRYEYILKRAHRTHRRAIHPPEYKRYPDPHQDNTHICGYQRRHYLHSLHHPRIGSTAGLITR